MNADRTTTLQRLATEIVAATGGAIRVLNDRRAEGRRGGGDVDCAARDLHPLWPLRLLDWRLCQALRYDVTATYYVLVRGEETLALDVLDDPGGLGRYGFASDALWSTGEPGGLAAPIERAAYLTLKRVYKGIADAAAWDDVRALARTDVDGYRKRLEAPLGEHRAASVANTILERAPSPAELTDWRRALRGRRLRRPSQAARHATLSLARVTGRLRRPTGLVVVLVGPDGSGKSTVADLLPDACGQLFRRSHRIHFRPGLLPRPGAIARRPPPDPTLPHSRAPHGRALSSVLLFYYWVDTLLGHAVRVFPARVRSSLVVVERGFLDLSVDPVRYRLDVSARLVRVLAALLPRSDVTFLLAPPAELAAARKPELAAAEVERQLAVWRARLEGRGAVELDSSRPLTELLGEARERIASRLEQRAVARLGHGWAVVPSKRNPRLWVPRGPRNVTQVALALASPSRTRSRALLGLAHIGAACGAMRLFDRTSLPADARRILAPYVPAGGTVALSRSVHLGRYVALLIDDSGSPTAIAKIATDDLGRARLRTERLAVDERAALLRPPLRGPTVVAADDDVLILEWVAARSRRRPWLLPAEVAHGLGDFFARGMFEEAATIRGPAHGDTAPWNLLRCGDEWLLVDWEVSLADAPPFFDVYHYIVQSHSHLGRPRRGELLRGVAGEGWIGEAIAAYAEGAGLSIAAAGPAFERYLEHTSTPGTMRDMAATGVRLRRELRWEVGG